MHDFDSAQYAAPWPSGRTPPCYRSDVVVVLRLDNESDCAVVFRFALPSSNRRDRSIEPRAATRPNVHGLPSGADPLIWATTLGSALKRRSSCC